MTRVLGIAAVLAAVAAAGGNDDIPCMPMGSITSLSLGAGDTTGRVRNPNVPKLQCQGNCPGDAFLESAQCQQAGLNDNGLPSWRCQGHFPANDGLHRPKFRLGSVRVSCEGCAKKGDSNVRQGSCSLAYSVLSRPARGGSWHTQRHAHDGARQEEADTFFTAIFLLALFGCCFVAAIRRNRSSHAPQYSPPPQQQLYDKDGNPVPMGTPVYGGQQQQQQSHDGGWRPGLGTGLFGGYLLGSMMGGGFGGHSTVNNYYGDGDSGYGGGGDSWGDGGGFGGGDSV